MISTSQTSDFQISGSAISSHKNIQIVFGIRHSLKKAAHNFVCSRIYMKRCLFSSLAMLFFVIFYIQKRLEKHPRMTDTIPCRIRKNPITQAIAAILANGCVNERKPITVRRIPSTVNQPQPFTPSF